MTIFPPPSRRSQVAPFMAMDVLREASALEKQGRRIIHMELGEPGAPAPRLVRDAAIAELKKGAIGYGEASGDANLRQRIARHYRDRYGVEVAAAELSSRPAPLELFNLRFWQLLMLARASPWRRLVTRPMQISSRRSALNASPSTSGRKHVSPSPPQRWRMRIGGAGSTACCS